MANNYDTVKGVDWREVFPWTALTRAFTVAVSIPVLLLASFGVGLTVSGWALAESLLVPEQLTLAPAGATTDEMESVSNQGDTFAEDTALQNAVETPFVDGSEQIPETTVAVQPPGHFAPAMGSIADGDTRSVFERLLVGEGLMLVADLHDMLLGGDRELDAKTSYAICIIDFVWLLIVWGFFGAMITRIAVIRIGRGEKIGLKEAMADVRKKYISYVMSPVFVLVSCFVLSLPIVLISLLLNFDIGVLLASVLWIVAIVASVGVAVLLTGFFFGWPLMWPTISAEEDGDVYEATSRTFAYTFQAPIQYLFYVSISLAIWVPSVMLVQNFTSLAEQVVFSGMNVAADEGQLIQDYLTGKVSLDGQSQIFIMGANIISGLHWFAHLMADAFCVGFFFASFSGIYLLLRRFVDHTPLDEVFVIDDRTKYGLEDLIQQSAEQSAETAS
ncbi:MAG: hypothetical protein HOB20_07485 [Planctomycetaceae bacterium]|jgi:hypothetical protein|nr:hypothetical protein [Planctomycetaceae bacterium]